MARTWLSVTVELLGGRGQDLWPWPGRVFAVGPSHTFMELADAINAAFARWDRAHLSMFTLADGRIVTDQETGDEMVESIGGPIAASLDIESTKLSRALEPGAEFQYTFDLGDNWTHRCLVDEDKIDPVEVLGIRPGTPLAYWGWGTIPDQYGRRWADADRFLAAVRGCEIDDALQQVAEGLPLALDSRRVEAEPVVASVINRLSWREATGDDVLADDLLALLRGEPLPGRAVPVDLEVLVTELEGDLDMSTGGYVDLQTGEVYGEHDTDPMMVGEEGAIDVDEEPDRWLWFDRVGSRGGWQDMASFAARQHDDSLRDRLERAIEGKGAFRRFRDLVHQEGLADLWDVYSTDRQLGRARRFLADEGIRVGRLSPGR